MQQHGSEAFQVSQRTERKRRNTPPNAQQKNKSERGAAEGARGGEKGEREKSGHRNRPGRNSETDRQAKEKKSQQGETRKQEKEEEKKRQQDKASKKKKEAERKAKEKKRQQEETRKKEKEVYRKTKEMKRRQQKVRKKEQEAERKAKEIKRQQAHLSRCASHGQSPAVWHISDADYSARKAAAKRDAKLGIHAVTVMAIAKERENVNPLVREYKKLAGQAAEVTLNLEWNPMSADMAAVVEHRPTTIASESVHGSSHGKWA